MTSPAGVMTSRVTQPVSVEHRIVFRPVVSDSIWHRSQCARHAQQMQTISQIYLREYGGRPPQKTWGIACEFSDAWTCSCTNERISVAAFEDSLVAVTGWARNDANSAQDDESDRETVYHENVWKCVNLDIYVLIMRYDRCVTDR